MDETEVFVEGEIKIKKPTMVEGLPGLGLVGKIAVDHLAKELKAKKFATMYSPYFPPQVMIQKDGTVDMIKNEFYYLRASRKEQSDLIFVTGNHQGATPKSHFEITGKILDIAELYDTQLIYTLGGYGTGRMSRKPRVFGAVNNKSLKKPLEKAGVSFDRGGSIVGVAGLLLGQGRQRGIKAACLMGETHGQIIDAKSAKSVLEILTKVLKLRKVDTSTLDKKAKETEEFLRKARDAQREDEILKKMPAEDDTTYIR
jgi:uncharacterized protein (TIGR00162 family)